MKYLIGIDGGTQSTKIQIFDLKGNVICESRNPLRPCVAREPGFSEHPDDDLWDVFVKTARELMQQFEGNPSDIVGIGLCTIRSCRTFLSEDGTLARPVMSWFDKRAFGPIQVEGDVRYVTTTTGYFTHRLTGNFADTVANNTVAQWPVDPPTWNWSEDEAEFARVNITRDRLVDLYKPGEILGYLREEVAEETGLPAGIPIVATANDKAVEALGSGLMIGDMGLLSLGTYIASMVPCDHFIAESNTFFCNFSSVPDKFLCESFGIWRGMWTISWFVNLLGEGLIREAAEQGMTAEELLSLEAAKVSPGSDGLMTVMEWLMPDHIAHKKGMMIGFDVRHTRAHMFRSIMEGIAMTMHRNFLAMCEETGKKPSRLVLSGGGSSSPVFTQIVADVFGIPVLRNKMSGAAGLGAAICAAVGTGIYDSFEEAQQEMVQIRDVFEPDEKNHLLYEKINLEVYSKLSDQNDELLKTLKSILE